MCRHEWRLSAISLWLLLLAVFLVPACAAGGAGGSQALSQPGGGASRAPVSAPAVNFFAASPSAVAPGQAVTLSWDVSAARTVTLYPDAYSVAPSGSREILPVATTTYTLSAANEGGTATRSVTVTVTAASGSLVGSDPVTGRNQGFDFVWEQLCLSTEYQVQISKDPIFSQVIFDSGPYAPPSSTSPALVFPVGARQTPFGAVAPYLSSQLEAGHTYYWRARVRQTATGQALLSPWSSVESFTIKAGFPTSTARYGITALTPANGCGGCPVVPVSFSWSPYKETSRYEFVLARDSEMTDVLARAETTTTGYEYKGKLEYASNYFWRVRAFEPAPSDWSATFSFQTEAAPPPPPAAAPPPETPLWVWVIVAIGAVLVIVNIVLVFKARRDKSGD